MLVKKFVEVRPNILIGRTVRLPPSGHTRGADRPQPRKVEDWA